MALSSIFLLLDFPPSATQNPEQILIAASNVFKTGQMP